VEKLAPFPGVWQELEALPAAAAAAEIVRRAEAGPAPRSPLREIRGGSNAIERCPTPPAKDDTSGGLLVEGMKEDEQPHESSAEALAELRREIAALREQQARAVGAW